MTTPKKAPCVDVRTDVHKDVKFEVLGEIAGYNRYEAIGRMHHLWSWCVDRGLKDAPADCDGYVVADAVVCRFLGPNGVAAILGDGCDDFALGARWGEGRIYLRGTSEYVTDRRARTATAKAGGEARANGPRDGETGRFVNQTTNAQPEPQQDASCPHPGHPSDGQPTPASSSSPSSSSSGSDTHAPRAIPGSTDYAQLTWETISAARIQIAAEFKLTNIIPMPDRFGMPSEPRGCRDLRDRIREEGANAEAVCKHIVANLIAQAREERSVEWLSEKAFTAGGWQTARNWTPGQQQKRQRARPAPTYGASKPSTQHPEQPALRPASEVLG